MRFRGIARRYSKYSFSFAKLVYLFVGSSHLHFNWPHFCVSFLINRPRNALFSMPVSLTVGDSSTCYQTFRKERHEVGQNRRISVNPCKGTTATEGFGKFESNALGDPYVDPGKYNNSLRKPRSNSALSKPFLTSSNKKIRKSEF